VRRPSALTALVILVLGALPLAGRSDAPIRRAVSLRVLQSVLQAGNSQQAQRLCGITRATGYILDKKGRDIILVGEVDSMSSPLYLDDFVVALRNARLIYVQRKGRAYYYAPPGCSIDPNPQVLRQLQEVNRNYPNIPTDPEQKQRFLDEWSAIGKQPQKVRVMGVPFDSRFAKVMVDADYYMKRLVDGSVALNIDGFESLTDITVNAAKQDMENGRPSSVPEHSLNRFWFCPGETTFTEDDGVVLLQSCPVRLLTEEEFLTSSGAVAGRGRPSAFAKRFTEAFTAKYQEIAAARPIYRELEGLFRFVGIAKLITGGSAPSAAGVNLDYLIKRYPIEPTGVSRAVPGKTNVAEFTIEKDMPEGKAYATFCLRSCGGVSMDVRPKRIKIPALKAQKPLARTAASVSKPAPSLAKPSASGSKPSTPALKPTVAAAPAGKPRPQPARPSLKKTVLAARKSSDSLYWDVPAAQ